MGGKRRNQAITPRIRATFSCPGNPSPDLQSGVKRFPDFLFFRRRGEVAD
jgi:hypothetical protein